MDRTLDISFTSPVYDKWSKIQIHIGVCAELMQAFYGVISELQ